MACDEVDRLKRRIDELERKLCERDCCKHCRKCSGYLWWQYHPYGYPNATGVTYTTTNNTSPTVTYTNSTSSSP